MPCSHCGSEKSFMHRSSKDFKPIVPKEIQNEFKEPPPPIVSPQITPPATPKSTVPISSSSSIANKPLPKPDVLPLKKPEPNTKMSESFTKTQSQEKQIETYLNFKNMLENLDNNIKQILQKQEKFEEMILEISKQLQDQNRKELENQAIKRQEEESSKRNMDNKKNKKKKK
ncbi:MAG: hypothetical protein ACW981_15700 [Candidatus Hodarchaeales archaeon]|jgi:hypothetical protein